MNKLKSILLAGIFIISGGASAWTDKYISGPVCVFYDEGTNKVVVHQDLAKCVVEDLREKDPYTGEVLL